MKKEVASLLIDLGCLKISPLKPFSYASGLKGPIYCDNRQILSHVDVRKIIIDYFVKSIKESKLKFDSIAGLATAGIPHAALIADKLNRPMIYIRSSAKKHGQRNQVEGYYKANDKIILIEDLVNQGSSLNLAVEGAREVELSVLACFAIVDYQMKGAKDILNKLKLPLISLTDFHSIKEVAIERNIIAAREIELLEAWHLDSQNYSV